MLINSVQQKLLPSIRSISSFDKPVRVAKSAEQNGTLLCEIYKILEIKDVEEKKNDTLILLTFFFGSKLQFTLARLEFSQARRRCLFLYNIEW